MAWYGSALGVFPADTTEGKLILANIPVLDSGGSQGPNPTLTPNPNPTP